ncbi:MAG: winged helix-turn-helix domain-containing protein [Dysgonamonadaceae bacterium]|nr:winged helix-turn-helix domain-containing protein [Dysgonamonadaceae bacterium]
MKNLHLLIYSKNYTLAENIKKILEETGRYRIRVEKKLVENYAVHWDDSHTFIITGEKERRHKKISPVKNQVFFGEFVLDVNFRTLQWKNQKLFHLSCKETKILAELIENANHIVTRNFLLYHYWGEISYYKSRSLDVLISKLRKYLSLDPSISIVNYRSEGLRLIY